MRHVCSPSTADFPYQYHSTVSPYPPLSACYYYLLTPWCRVLLEQLTGLQLVKTFPEFHGTRRFITALTSVRHLSLSWASPILSIYPHPTSLRSILILSAHLRLGLTSGLSSTRGGLAHIKKDRLSTSFLLPSSRWLPPCSLVMCPVQFGIGTSNDLPMLNEGHVTV